MYHIYGAFENKFSRCPGSYPSSTAPFIFPASARSKVTRARWKDSANAANTHLPRSSAKGIRLRFAPASALQSQRFLREIRLDGGDPPVEDIPALRLIHGVLLHHRFGAQQTEKPQLCVPAKDENSRRGKGLVPANCRGIVRVHLTIARLPHIHIREFNDFNDLFAVNIQLVGARGSDQSNWSRLVGGFGALCSIRKSRPSSTNCFTVGFRSNAAILTLLYVSSAMSTVCAWRKSKIFIALDRTSEAGPRVPSPVPCPLFFCF